MFVFVSVRGITVKIPVNVKSKAKQKSDNLFAKIYLEVFRKVLQLALRKIFCRAFEIQKLNEIRRITEKNLKLRT